MARLLCVWELGGQLGHLNRLKLPIERALHQGHQVFLAARELRGVQPVLGDLPVTVLQAPFKQNFAAPTGEQFLSYTHLIARQCFTDANELAALVRAWRGLFDLVQPQAVLFEHSPTALIAALPYGFRKILIGQGFGLPPASATASAPFARFPTTAESPQVRDALLSDDAQLAATINQALLQSGEQPINYVADIYAQAHGTLCMTWPALDPFGPRDSVQYLGAESLAVSRAPVWPAGEGPRVFGYLQPFPALTQLLKDLQSAGVRALLCVRDAPAALMQAYATGSVQITTAMVDMQRVTAEAQWVISHGNHSTVATVGLGGLPQMLIPRQQEQLFLSLRLARQGSAVVVFQDQTGFTKAIDAMQTMALLKLNAVQLQAQMAAIDPTAATRVIDEVLDSALNPPVPEAGGVESPRFCFITTCKGRLHHLQQTLPLVACVPGAEVVVVDYDCPDGTAAWVATHFPHVRVVTVQDALHFNVAHARNLGAQGAKADWLVFFDADVCLLGGFFDWLASGLQEGHFYTVQGGTPDLMGTCVVANAVFQSLGGYDEVFSGWGQEDMDLYRGLVFQGCHQARFSGALLRAIAHDDEQRTRFREEKDINKSLLIQNCYAKMKSDIMRVTRQSLDMAQRRALHRAVTKAVDEALQAGEWADGESIRIDLPSHLLKLRTPINTPLALGACLVYKVVATGVNN